MRTTYIKKGDLVKNFTTLVSHLKSHNLFANVVIGLSICASGVALASGASHPEKCSIRDPQLMAMEGIGGNQAAATADAERRLQAGLDDFARDCRDADRVFESCPIESKYDWTESGNVYVTAEAKFSCR